jgi:hypothetical protein
MTQFQWLWLAYIVFATSLLVFALERSVRKINMSLSLSRGRFIPTPAILCIASMFLYVVAPPKDPDVGSSLADPVLLLGLLAMFFLPILVAVPAKTFPAYIPVCWGTYLLWSIIVFWPFMLFCGVPLQG